MQTPPQTSDRPREKLDRLGVSALGDNELLAVVLGHGTAGLSALALSNRLLSQAGGVHGLTRRRMAELRQAPGFGGAQAARVLAAIELGRRTLIRQRALRPRIVEARDLAAYLSPEFGSHPVERSGVVLFDIRQRLLQVRLLSSGSPDACQIDPRDVFREGVMGAAAGVAVFHNHPSGDPVPSGADEAITARLRFAGDVMGIQLVDHLILADTRYYSFREHGILARDGPRRLDGSATSY
jgi:DNA repair protein RadC